MTQAYEVTLESTAEETLEQLIDYKAINSECRYEPDPYEDAFYRVQEIVDKAVKKLSDGLISYKICPMLLELGETRYHELVESGYRFIYRRFEDENTVSIYAVIHERQDIEQILIDYCLIRL